VPKKGAKKQLLDLVKKNIEISFFGDITKVDELQKRLQLQETPFVIECFDISHLSGTSTVGSMVQFRKGKPDKSNYRRFRIRTVVGVDDVAAIGEVVRRRYTRLKQEHAEMPHLIIIDGGRGQLNSTVHELEKLDVKIPVISIAKKFEEIYLPGSSQPIRLAKKEKALLFIQEIRDEAHRFAISYNRLLRRKKLRE
jgi:excinuclease ABC subunit C